MEIDFYFFHKPQGTELILHKRIQKFCRIKKKNFKFYKKIQEQENPINQPRPKLLQAKPKKKRKSQ